MNIKTVEEIVDAILALDKKERRLILKLVSIAAEPEEGITPPPLPEGPGKPPVGP